MLERSRRVRCGRVAWLWALGLRAKPRHANGISRRCDRPLRPPTAAFRRSLRSSERWWWRNGSVTDRHT